jgi:hypothetical protein
VTKTLRDIDLVDKANTFAKHLSGGQKRKLSIGIAVIGDPRVCSSVMLKITNFHNERFSTSFTRASHWTYPVPDEFSLLLYIVFPLRFSLMLLSHHCFVLLIGLLSVLKLKICVYFFLKEITFHHSFSKVFIFYICNFIV